MTSGTSVANTDATLQTKTDDTGQNELIHRK